MVSGRPMPGMASTKSAAAAASDGATRCQRRSWKRSELRPTRYMVTAASAYGSISRMPTCLRFSTPAARIIDGAHAENTPEPRQIPL
ncbi:hypothetical protein D3C80_1988830 [compost metagenome]